MQLHTLEPFKRLIPPYLYALAAGMACLLSLWLVKRVLFRRLKRLAESNAVLWDEVLLEALSFPVDFLIFASGLWLIMSLLPLPVGLEHAAGFALQGVIVLAMVIFSDHFLIGMMDRNAKKGVFAAVSIGLLKGLVRGFIFGIGALVFLDLAGISITPILASLGIGSLAVALALQDTLANFFAGLYVVIDKPVEVGHFVRLESGQEGFVMEVGWRSTRILTLPNNTVIIPNSKLMGSVITNYHLPVHEVVIQVDAVVHYESDLEKVERVVAEVGKEVMQKNPGGVPSFQPSLNYHTFGDSGIHFTVMLRVREFTDIGPIKHEFMKKLLKRFREEGIVIPYPTRTILTEKNG